MRIGPAFSFLTKPFTAPVSAMRFYMTFCLALWSLNTLAQTADSTEVQHEADTLEPAVVLPPAVLFRSGTYEAVLQEAKRTNKPILIDFWATWCAPCRRLDRETFTDIDLGEYVNTHFIPYRVDIDDFSGMDLVDRYGVKVYPTMLVIHPTGKTILRTITGFFLPNYLQAELAGSLQRKAAR